VPQPSVLRLRVLTFPVSFAVRTNSPVFRYASNKGTISARLRSYAILMPSWSSTFGRPLMNSAIEPPSVAVARRTHISVPFFLLQVSRPGLCATTALFYLLPLGREFHWRSAGFWAGLVYILFPLGLLLYGVNDIADADGDRYNPRKGTYLFGARGETSQLKALRWQIAAFQAPFLFLFLVWIGPKLLAWLAALLLAVFVYNARPFAWKGRPPFDVLIQASYLLVFVLSSWLNKMQQLPWQAFLFGAMFAMHSHLFGEVMDIGPDRKSGRKTLAIVLGTVPTKLLIAVFLASETALVFWFFRDLVISGFLLAGALWFVLDAAIFWRRRPYTTEQMRLFLWGWNVAALLGIFWNAAHGSLLKVTRLPLR
jgi:4-hydroxybenzoate polyprenyltransferase